MLKQKKTAVAFHDNYIEYESEGVEGLSVQQYLESIRPCSHDMIDYFFYSLVKPKFMSSTNSNGKSMVHIKNDNIEIMIDEKTDKINQELIDLL